MATAGSNTAKSNTARSQSAKSDSNSGATIRDLHANDHAHALLHTAASLTYVGLMGVAIWSWYQAHWLVTVLAWCVAGHLGHSKLIAFHESSHGTLNPRRWLNEVQGIMVGTIIFVPLSVYRYVHGQHHAYLGTERDLEMWPFVNPEVPRWKRLLAAFGELFLGFFYTPIVFLRGVLVGTNIPPGQMKRIKWEYALCGAIWTVQLITVHINNWWVPLMVGYLIPSVIAGNLQSLRKFTEHMGLTGNTILTITRTVVDRRHLGEFLSETMLRIDYHGTHHRYAKLPFYNLPEATPIVFGEGQPALPIYTSYLQAMLDMARTLDNPRVGAQWLEQPPQRSAPLPATNGRLRTQPLISEPSDISPR